MPMCPYSHGALFKKRAKCSPVRRLDLSQRSLQIMGVVIRNDTSHRSEYAQIVYNKMAFYMALVTKCVEKSPVGLLEAVIKLWYHCTAHYKMEWIYIQTKVRV